MTTPAHIPTRAEIPAADTWDLSRLFSDETEYRTALDELKTLYPKLAARQGTLHRSAEDLFDVLELEKAVDLLSERIGHYVSLRNAEDSSNAENLARKAELANLYTRISEATAFMTPEIQQIPDDVFSQFLADPLLDEWRTMLTHVRRFRPHTLLEGEERILAAGASAIRGHRDTFSQLTNVDMKFGSVIDADGQSFALSQSNYISLLHRTDRSIRRKAFEQFYQEFQDHQYTLASALSASVRADVFYAKVRHYPSARAASLFADNIPLSVYDNLIGTVRRNLPALHDYYDLRQQALGLGELHQYDTFVPLVPQVKRQHLFDEAIDLTCSALAPLGPEYVETLRQGLRSRWVDRYESKGKRSGAFSSSSYGNPPFILMNYKPDVFSDVFTLAHEAGHSMHTWLAQRHQRFQDYGYPIFLAEVASTFNEELLTHYLLERAEDVSLRAYLIDRQIEDIRGTFFRQTMFAEFEKQIHEIEERGDPLTLDVFGSAYHELLAAYFGPRFMLDPQLDLECLRIPHFYSAFYVYKYATGIAAAVTLARRVLEGGPAEVAAYLEFLKSGGSKFPLETLAAAGVDMRAPEPIEQVVNVFQKRVTELRQLLLR
ncbi:MAG TPA: oligoendopeptidase F [Chthoniobacterales bacterium]